jgi:uncharacterized protein YjiS (DUF1127 family)
MTAAQISQQARWHAHESRRLAALLDLIRTWRRRAYERQMLAGMNDQLLRDIGITRCDAMNEASKPFWRA